MLKSLIAIFFGGGAGSVLRYAVQMLVHERFGTHNFPWSTFAVNVAGCFLIGLFYALSEKLSLSADTRLLLTAGFCGGFTTFSTFSNDNLAMLRQGDIAQCATYTVLSIVLGVGACMIGAWLCSPKS